MDPLSITASLIAVLQVSGTVISALYEYRNGVKSASNDAARIIAELNSLRSILESLLQAVGKEDSKISFSSDGGSRLANFQALTQPNGELKRCQVDLEAVNVKLGGDDASSLSGWKKMRRALVWPFKEKDVEKLLQSLQRAKSTMQLALSADQTSLILEMHDGVSNLTRQFAVTALDQRRQRIRDWLCAPDPYPNHAAARKKRQPLTGNWFLGGEMYESWRSSPGSFLWLYGIPGSGKSILCSSIIENLLSHPADSSIAIAFYYFDFNDIGKRDTTTLIRALIAQILPKIPATSKSLEVLSSKTEREQPDEELLLQVLRTFILEQDQVYIVIDALDECEECEELMKVIEIINNWGFDKLHILVASRQLPEIQEVLTDCATSSICLQNSINVDIHILIQERLSSDRKFQKWPYQVRREIDGALTARASGMFRWVVCQLDMLRNCVTLPALRKALKSLPKTLDETYERILTNIDESYADDVRRLLHFLTFSPRAMNLKELVEVLAIDVDAEEPLFDPENRIPDPKDILTMCSTLVTTVNMTGYPSTEPHLDTCSIVRLAHFSVQEYLLSERIKSSKASLYSMDPISGNLFIAKSYLVYLLGPQFAEGHCGRNGLMYRRKTFPLFPAAVLLFPIHIGIVDNCGDDQVDNKTKQLVQRLFSTQLDIHGGNYAAWVGGLIPEANTHTIVDTPPLYYAASFGMTSIVKMLLANMPQSEIDTKGGRAQSSPLHVACFRGKLNCVELLLEAGADPNSTNSKGESCIYWARDTGNPDYKNIRDLLIKFGADDDGRSNDNADLVEVVEQLEKSYLKKHSRTRTEVLTEKIESDHYEREYHRLESAEPAHGIPHHKEEGVIIPAAQLNYIEGMQFIDQMNDSVDSKCHGKGTDTTIKGHNH